MRTFLHLFVSSVAGAPVPAAVSVPHARPTGESDATAQTNLGMCYKEGRGVEKDEEKAVDYYRLAAAKGNAYAQRMLVCGISI